MKNTGDFRRKSLLLTNHKHNGVAEGSSGRSILQQMKMTLDTNGGAWVVI